MAATATKQKEESTIVLNKVREYCDKKGWDRSDFLAICLTKKIVIEGKRLSPDTIVRIYDGATDINMRTAALVTRTLGLSSIAELFDLQ